MAAPVHIKDPGTSKGARVDRDGSLRVANWWVHPRDITSSEVAQRKAWAAHMVDASGSRDLAINGATTPTRFSVVSRDDRIEWVHEIRLVIHSELMDLSKALESRRFGPVAAPGLTSGLQLKVNQRGVITDLFLEPVQVIQDFERYATATGRGIVNTVDGVATGTDFLMCIVRLESPIGLYPGSADSVYIDVVDDLSGLTLFEVDVFGVQELLDT